MKKIIFTFIIDSHDELKPPSIITPGWDYLCITDNPKLKSKIWDVVQIKDKHKSIECPKKRAMSVMIGYNNYIDDSYDVCISIGGQMLINTDLDDFLKIQGFNDTHNIMISKHPARNCIYDEGKAVLGCEKDTEVNIKRHINILKGKGYPKNYGLYATGYIAMNNKNKTTKKLFKEWSAIYLKYPSRRDQMSLNYTIWALRKKGHIINVKETIFKEIFGRRDTREDLNEEAFFVENVHKRKQKFKQ